MTAVDIAELYRQHRVTIVAYLCRRGCNRDLAEDLTQDAFVRFIRFTDRYRDLGKPDVLLRTIARNLLLDHRKSMRVRRAGRYEPSETDQPLFGRAPTDPGERVATLIDQAGLVARVREVLADLNPVNRRVIELRFRQELTVEETAQVLGSNVGAVKAMTYRARQKLAADERLQPLRTEVTA